MVAVVIAKHKFRNMEMGVDMAMVKPMTILKSHPHLENRANAIPSTTLYSSLNRIGHCMVMVMVILMVMVFQTGIEFVNEAYSTNLGHYAISSKWFLQTYHYAITISIAIAIAIDIPLHARP